MPIKQPKMLDACLTSLIANADLAFAPLHFCFGIDWNDTATGASIAMSVAALRVNHTVFSVYDRGSDVSMIVNEMFSLVDDDAGYFLRFNDDTHMLTPNWNRLAIEALRQHPRDIGLARIVDPRHPATLMQTHSFVSARHRDIFGLYFSAHFKNSAEDAWITGVYAGNLTKDSGVRINHHASGTRYKLARVPQDVFKYSVAVGRARVAAYLESNKTRCDRERATL
jgi:hypothetical protein